MEGSILVVNIDEARDLTKAIPAYVEVTFDQQKQATMLKAATNNPHWNEKFTFDVITGKEVVQMALCSGEMVGKKVVGTCEFPLTNLRSPDYTFDDWIKVQASNGRDEGKINVQLKWIVSQVEFFENIIIKLERELDDKKNQKQLFVSKLALMHRIYG